MVARRRRLPTASKFGVTHFKNLYARWLERINMDGATQNF
jgi:hypothetical protein